MTMTQHIEARRKAHQKALANLAGGKIDGLALWRKLAALERKIYQVCLRYTNGEGVTLEMWDACKGDAKAKLTAIFGGTIPKGVFINGDPRGHMLKLDCDLVAIPDGMECDWGGNGILAAEIIL